MAREYGVGWHTAMRAVQVHGQPLVDDPARRAGLAALRMGETPSRAPTGSSHDVRVGAGRHRHGRLLDVVEDGTAKVVAEDVRPGLWA